jgi:alanine-glyoxylate transaminase/serine-glyoxylate transaminase/serine-pyruvate transaminase
MDPRYIEIFQRVFKGMRSVFGAPGGQPVLFNGGGLLALEAACASLLEPDDEVLVVDNGFFGEMFTQIIKCHVTRVKVLSASLGDQITTRQVEEELKKERFRVLAFSHVETSTGVRAQIKELAETAQAHGALTMVDGVSAVGGELVEQEALGVDVYCASTQKALAAPPGLALLMLGSRAVDTLERRKTPIKGFYLDLSKWVDSMRSYEDGGPPRLVSTPSTNLVQAFVCALEDIMEERVVDRVKRHATIAETMRAGLGLLGYPLVPKHPRYFANTVTAAFVPSGIQASQLVREVARLGVLVAPGIGSDRDQLIRIGHMGGVTLEDVETTLAALRQATTISSKRL